MTSKAAPIILASALLALFSSASTAQESASLFLVDQETQVSDVRFAGNETFESNALAKQTATKSRTTLDKVLLRKKLGYVFSPLELQKDVARLRRFYSRNGFPDARIDYVAELDSADNRIDITYTIQENEPTTVLSVDFFGPDQRPAIFQFPEDERDRWEDIRSSIEELEVGARLTQFQITSITDRTLEGLTNAGYAFARVTSELEEDTTYNVADVRFLIDPGPLTRFDDILIEGNESVDRQIVRRELPFKKGDIYSNKKLVEGQRQVFGLDLFRIALAEVPFGQPRDSTVQIRMRVQEAPTRYLTAEAGYAIDRGLNGQLEWNYRNFLGSARRLTASAEWSTGALAYIGQDRDRTSQVRLSLSFRQPYISTTRLSGILTSFFNFERRQTTNADREVGLISNLIYEILPFRTISLRHTYSFAFPLGEISRIERFYNKSVLNLSATSGRVDSWINPTRGFFLRPFVEFGGGVLTSDVAFFKAGAEGSLYLPFSNQTGVALRLYLGRLYPFGVSSDQATPVNRIRFDTIRFYAGGNFDVRGWEPNLLGPVVAGREALVAEGDTLRSENGSPTYNYFFEPLGATHKLAGSVEFRLPMPFLDRKWQNGLFLDYGQAWGPDIDIANQNVDLKDLKLGAGWGLRFLTPAGYLRLDVGFKLNPSDRDLQSAEELFLGLPPSNRNLFGGRRNYIHLAIGQAF